MTAPLSEHPRWDELVRGISTTRIITGTAATNYFLPVGGSTETITLTRSPPDGASQGDEMPRLQDVRDRTDLYVFDTAEFTTSKYPAIYETRRVTQKVLVPGHMGLGTIEEEQTTETVVQISPASESCHLSSIRISDNANVGHREKTNMNMPGQLAGDAVAVIKGIEFSVPPEHVQSWSGCHWTLIIGCKEIVSMPLAQVEQVSSSPLATIFRYIFTRDLLVAARQAFAMRIERFGEQIPRGEMKVAMRGILTRDCL